MHLLTNIQHHREKGFTLIELVIAVAIVAILASIALPSYRAHVIKAARSDAQSAMMSFANAMERHFTTNGTYMDAGTTDTDGNGDGDTGAPTIFNTTVPLDGGPAKYNLTISAVTASSYTLNAEAVGSQNGDGDMELTSTGVRRWDRDDDGFGGSDNCWDKNC